jgi:peroxiredoxin
MKKILLFAALLLLILQSQAQNGFTLTGNVSGAKDDTVKICRVYDGEVLYSMPLENGKFKLKYKGKFQGDKVYLKGAGLNNRFFIYLEPGKIEIEGTSKSMKATGTPSNDAFNTYTKEVSAIEQKIAATRVELKNETDPKLKNELMTRLGTELEKFYEFRKEFAYKYNNTILAAEFLSAGTGHLTYADMKQLVSKLDPKTPANWYTKRLLERLAILDKTDFGKVLPDFTLPDTSGNPVTFSSLRGNIVLVDFWASWCKPCREENQNVLKLYKQYNNAGFTVISVSIDDKKANWTKAIVQDQLPWYHVSSLTGWDCKVANSLGVKYGMSGVPYTLLVGRDGKVIGHNVRGEKLEEKLKELFSQGTTKK